MRAKKMSGKTKSLTRKMIVVNLTLLICTVLVCTLLTNILVNQFMVSYMINDNEILTQSISQSVSQYINKIYGVSLTIANSNDITGYQPAVQSAALKNAVDLNQEFELLYVQDPGGMQVARSSGECQDRSGRWWYKQVCETQKPFVTESYFSLFQNTAVTSVITPVMKNGKIIGSMGADVSLSEIQKIVDKYEMGDMRYVFVVDGKGVVVAHPDAKQIEELYNYKTSERMEVKKDANGNIVLDANGAQITQNAAVEIDQGLLDAVSKALDGQSGSIQYTDMQRQNMVATYAPVETPGVSDGWAVVTVENQALLGQMFDGVKAAMLVLCGVLALVACVILYFTSKKIVQPIRHMTRAAGELAKGNLQVDVSSTSNDEVGLLADSLSVTIGSIKNYIQEITFLLQELSNGNFKVRSHQEYAGDFAPIKQALKQIVHSLNSAMQAINQSSRHIFESAQTISDDSRQLAAASVEQQGVISDLSGAAEEISGKINRTYENTVHAERLTEQTVTQLNDSNLNIQEMVSAMSRIKNASMEISSIMRIIDDFAEQTNMLSVNASVEAARAGAAGKGFAVVASEVRRLANKSAEASREIAGLIENSNKAVDGGMTVAEKTAGTMMETISSSRKMSDIIKAIAQISDEQVSDIRKVTESVQVMARMAEQTNALALNEEQTGDNLFKQVNALNQLLARFELEDASPDSLKRLK